MVPLPAVSWPWVLAWGLLEPPRQDGENAQKTGIFGEKMGEIRPKKCEPRELTKDQLAGGAIQRAWGRPPAPRADAVRAAAAARRARSDDAPLGADGRCAPNPLPSQRQSSSLYRCWAQTISPPTPRHARSTAWSRRPARRRSSCGRVAPKPPRPPLAPLPPPRTRTRMPLRPHLKLRHRTRPRPPLLVLLLQCLRRLRRCPRRCPRRSPRLRVLRLST